MNESLESILDRLKTTASGTAVIDAAVIPEDQTTFDVAKEIVDGIPADVAVSASTSPQRIFLAWEPRAPEDYPIGPS